MTNRLAYIVLAVLAAAFLATIWLTAPRESRELADYPNAEAIEGTHGNPSPNIQRLSPTLQRTAQSAAMRALAPKRQLTPAAADANDDQDDNAEPTTP